MRTLTHAHMHTQFNHKKYFLGNYAVEADAAAARDVVAKVLGYPLNFKKPRKITGQRSNGADQAVADAAKVASAFLLGNSMNCASLLVNKPSKCLLPLLCPNDPQLKAQAKRKNLTTQKAPPPRRHRHRHRPQDRHPRLRLPRKPLVIR